MNSYRDHLWFILDEWIHYIENTCDTYGTQLVFTNIHKFHFCHLNLVYIVMLSMSFLYPYKRFSVSAKICDIVCQIRGGGNYKCSLLLMVYDDSIGLTIADASVANTFVIDTFSDYITIFHSLPHSFS